MRKILATAGFLLLGCVPLFAQSGVYSQNQFLAGPTSGSGFASPRLIVAADVPAIPVAGLSGLAAGIASWLAAPSSANLAGALTDETGTGLAVFGTAPTISSLNATTAMTLAFLAGGGTRCIQVSNTGVVSAAACSAGTVTQIIASTGAVTGTCTTACNVPSQTAASGAVTLSDASGAGLTFAAPTAAWSQIGNMIFLYGEFSYPTTANGSTALIAFTGAPAFIASTYGRQCSVTRSNVMTTVPYLLPVAGAQQLSPRGPNGATVTNAALTTNTFDFVCIYPAT